MLYLRPNASSSKTKGGRAFITFSSTLYDAIEMTSMGEIILPVSVRNLLYPAITPKNSAKTISQGALGDLSLNYMKESHMNHERPMVVGYEGSYPPCRVHNNSIYLAAITHHDGWHQLARSYLPKTMYDMLLHCVEVIQKETKIQMSFDIWNLYDLIVIDDGISVFDRDPKNQFDPNVTALTFSPDEELPQELCEEWLYKILCPTLISHSLVKVLLHNMLTNRSDWEQWISVNRFALTCISDGYRNEGDEHLSFNGFKQAYIKPHTLHELLTQDNLATIFEDGFIAGWFSIKFSLLGKLLHYRKNEENKTRMYLFRHELNSYSDRELRKIILDVRNNNLIGFDFINAAATGNIDELKIYEKDLQKIEVFSKLDEEKYQCEFNYPLIALNAAVKNGQTQCAMYIFNFLLNDTIKTNPNYYLQTALFDAATRGDLEIISLLLDGVSFNNDTISFCFLEAAKRKKTAVVDLMLSRFNTILSEQSLRDAALSATDHDNPIMLEKMLFHLKKYFRTYNLKALLFFYLRNDPVKSIAFLIKTFVEDGFMLNRDFFLITAKAGATRSVNEFIYLINQKYHHDETKRNEIILDCMLHGFAPINSGMNDFYGAQYNLYHDIVKIQIDQYLSASMTMNDKQCPRKEDIKKLIQTIFVPSMDALSFCEVESQTLCEIALKYLLNHEKIKANNEIHKLVIDSAMHESIQHPEPYYLRLMFREGCNFSITGEEGDMYFNNTSASPQSESTSCLVWIAGAINEIEKQSPDLSLVHKYFNSAIKCDSFKNEMFALIHGGSIPLSIHTLRAIDRHFYKYNDILEIRRWLAERIESLRVLSVG